LGKLVYRRGAARGRKTRTGRGMNVADIFNSDKPAMKAGKKGPGRNPRPVSAWREHHTPTCHAIAQAFELLAVPAPHLASAARWRISDRRRSKACLERYGAGRRAVSTILNGAKQPTGSPVSRSFPPNRPANGVQSVLALYSSARPEKTTHCPSCRRPAAA